MNDIKALYALWREKATEPDVAAELAAALRRDGFDVPEDIIDEEGLADWLCALK